MNEVHIMWHSAFVYNDAISLSQMYIHSGFFLCSYLGVLTGGVMSWVAL